MLEMLPLSPVREWAISRSFIGSALHELDGWLCEFARHKHRGDRDHIARRFKDTPASSRPIGVKRFNLVANSNGLTQVLGPPGNADTHFIRLVRTRRDFRPVQRVDADQIEPQLACG